ncbi:MAG TPA: hypothetical protein VGN14_06430 [Candidatus Elarobacter sp.]
MLVFFYLIVLAVAVVPMCLIARRLGFGWGWGLLSVVPLANIVLLWVLALAPAPSRGPVEHSRI